MVAEWLARTLLNMNAKAAFLSTNSTASATGRTNSMMTVRHTLRHQEVVGGEEVEEGMVEWWWVEE